jgi:hypothetical protein
MWYLLPATDAFGTQVGANMDFDALSNAQGTTFTYTMNEPVLEGKIIVFWVEDDGVGTACADTGANDPTIKLTVYGTIHN